MILENASDLQIYQVECKKKKYVFDVWKIFVLISPPPSYVCVGGCYNIQDYTARKISLFSS